MPAQDHRLTVPSDKKIKANVVAWLRYFVAVSSKKKVAAQMGMSLAHISNVHNHPEEHGPGLRFLLRMHFGLDISMRELVYQDPPAAQAPRQPPPSGVQHPQARSRAERA